MRITSLQPQATNADRVNIFVDGHFLLGVSLLSVVKMGLRVGLDLTEQQLQQLREEEAVQQAVGRALNFLSFRPRSREEIRRYLRRKETAPALIDTVLERLEHLELVDDRGFATFWIESRERFQPKGAQAIKNELRMKGVARDVVDELVDDEQDEERALVAGRKKALTLLNQSTLDYNTFRSRLGPFLQRRGFSYEVVSRTVRTLWQELGGAQDQDGDTE
ncbi:MAG TPA: RecX family transcriptional regulator [Ktedonobacteraceae bacterium]|nr:RecX family transcriptional regulator [Ktedonobacteraceae bacterium]